MSAASSRAEAEAEASGRVKESEKRLLSRIQGLEEAVDGKVRGIDRGREARVIERRMKSVMKHLALISLVHRLITDVLLCAGVCCGHEAGLSPQRGGGPEAAGPQRARRPPGGTS